MSERGVSKGIGIVITIAILSFLIWQSFAAGDETKNPVENAYVSLDWSDGIHS
ncbi:MAG: hypothetical protein U9O96_02060 [Candidatus Thermoplasmatota archaeon]|nr:hypothetical protein [Candidatus Thermoplasmatota archaeon]